VRAHQRAEPRQGGGGRSARRGRRAPWQLESPAVLHAITVIDHTGAERRARGIDDTDVQGQDKGSRLLLISAPHHVSASDSSVLIDHTHIRYMSHFA